MDNFHGELKMSNHDKKQHDKLDQKPGPEHRPGNHHNPKEQRPGQPGWNQNPRRQD